MSIKENINGCHYCLSNLKEVDYKDPITLRKFVSGYMRILPPKNTKLCSKHQRKLARAVKLSRIMALLPFTNR